MTHCWRIHRSRSSVRRNCDSHGCIFSNFPRKKSFKLSFGGNLRKLSVVLRCTRNGQNLTPDFLAQCCIPRYKWDVSFFSPLLETVFAAGNIGILGPKRPEQTWAVLGTRKSHWYLLSDFFLKNVQIAQQNCIQVLAYWATWAMLGPSKHHWRFAQNLVCWEICLSTDTFLLNYDPCSGSMGATNHRKYSSESSH